MDTPSHLPRSGVMDAADQITSKAHARGGHYGLAMYSARRRDEMWGVVIDGPYASAEEAATRQRETLAGADYIATFPFRTCHGWHAAGQFIDAACSAAREVCEDDDDLLVRDVLTDVAVEALRILLTKEDNPT